MLLLFKAFLMGIVEGLTEFLPVSSTGHLIIVGDLIGFNDGSFSVMFDIVIQLGAILAVIYYYRHKIINSLKNLKPGKWGFKLWLKIFIAFVPAAVIGILINDFVEAHLFSSFTVAIALIIGAFLILLVEAIFWNYRVDNMDEITGGQALIIGLMQCLSLFPGMSRSASSIMGGMIAGMSVKAAAEFSFFLAIPTMIAASGYSLFKGFSDVSSLQWAALAVGFITSFIVALIVVDRFLKYLAKHPLRPFAYYRLVVGILMLFLVYQGIVS